MPPTMRTILIPTRNLAAAKTLYTTLLGTEPMADAEYYVGYEVGGVHVGIVPGGADQGLPAPVAYWDVADIHAALADVVAAGGKELQSVRAVGGGRQVATFADADGNVIGLSQDQPPS